MLLQIKEIPELETGEEDTSRGTGVAGLDRLPGEEPDEASDLPPPPGTVMIVDHVGHHAG